MYEVIASSTGNVREFEASDSLIAGNVYSFKVKTRNAVGLSDYSSQV